MRRGGLERFAPLTGVLFVALFIPAFILGGEPPDADEKLGEVVDFWTSNDDELIIGALFGALATFFLLWFVGTLRSALRAAEGGSGRVSAISFAGGVVLVAGAALAVSIQFAAADTAGDVEPAVTQTLSVMNSDVFFTFGVGMAVLLIAAGIVIVRTAVFPRWLGWGAIVAGILSMTPAWFVAFGLWLIWTVIVAILLFRRGDTEQPQSSAAASGAP
jgi:hypothetical protein